MDYLGDSILIPCVPTNWEAILSRASYSNVYIHNGYRDTMVTSSHPISIETWH
jgi:hypothetical protein